MIKTFEVNGEIAIAFGDWAAADSVSGDAEPSGSGISGAAHSVLSWRCYFWTGGERVRELEVFADVRADGSGGLAVAYIGGTRFEALIGSGATKWEVGCEVMAPTAYEARDLIVQKKIQEHRERMVRRAAPLQPPPAMAAI